MGLSLDISLSAVTVFLQGLLSFFSPCVLPLLPIYVGYLSGGTVVYETDGSVRCDRKKVLINTLFFVIGISFAFVVLGLGMSLVGVFFRRHQRIFSLIGGVLVILFGLYQLGAFGTLRFLSTEKRFRLPVEKLAASPLTALLMGFCFSFSWTPCIGPTLSSVLLMAASSASAANGFLLVGVYALGFVLPFLAVGFFAATLLHLFRKHRNVVRYTGKVGGVILILMGILMLTGELGRLSELISQAG